MQHDIIKSKQTNKQTNQKAPALNRTLVRERVRASLNQKSSRDYFFFLTSKISSEKNEKWYNQNVEFMDKSYAQSNEKLIK